MRLKTSKHSTPAVWSIVAYQQMLGWPVQRRDGQAWLSLGTGIVAATLPEPVGRKVASALDESDVSGPVLRIDHSGRWYFLADPNGYVPGWEGVLGGVEVLGCPSCLPLPVSGLPGRRSAWVVSPDPHRRWLPTLSSIVALASR